MSIKLLTGIDIVYIPDFGQSVRDGGNTFLNKIFNKEELKITNTEHLAGLFSAKEAVIKALNLKIGSWLSIIIKHRKSGKPFVELPAKIKSNVKNYDLSISHNKNYAVAVFVALGQA